MFSPLAPKLFMPTVTFLDVASSTVDGSSFTFTNMALGGMSAVNPHADDETETGANATFPYLGVWGRKSVIAFVHGEDAASNFNVSGVSIGGVAGIELVDRNGTTVTIDTAIYGWNCKNLAEITNTDVIVTWSEVVGSCAVGLVEVDGLRVTGKMAQGVAQTAGDINILLDGLTDPERFLGGITLMAITCATGGGTETPSFISRTAGNTALNAYEPDILYFGNNVDTDYAAAYFLHPAMHFPHTLTERHGAAANWSGTGNGDGAAIYIG